MATESVPAVPVAVSALREHLCRPVVTPTARQPVIADTIAREGWDFAFSPEKVTLYVDDFLARQKWYANYTG